MYTTINSHNSSHDTLLSYIPIIYVIVVAAAPGVSAFRWVCGDPEETSHTGDGASGVGICICPIER